MWIAADLPGMYRLAAVLLHEGHEATGGGPDTTAIAVGVLAAAGLVAGLYLLATAVERAPDDEDRPDEGSGEATG